MKNMKLKLFTAFLAALVTLCAISGCASALVIQIRNDFDKTMNIVVVYLDKQAQKWRTRGWYPVEKNSEKNLTFSSSSQSVYLYAYLTGFGMIWEGGDITRTVIGEAFSYYDGEVCPEGKNRREIKLAKYDAVDDVVEFRPVSPTPVAPAAPLEVAGNSPVNPALHQQDTGEKLYPQFDVFDWGLAEQEVEPGEQAHVSREEMAEAIIATWKKYGEPVDANFLKAKNLVRAIEAYDGDWEQAIIFEIACEIAGVDFDTYSNY